jgi:hypothetical protein
MNKTALMAGVALLVLGIGVSIAAARPWNRNLTDATNSKLAQVAENGTYNDLLNLRNETGRQLFPRVQDQKSFEQWQEHYQWMAENGMGPGMMYRYGAGGAAGAGNSAGNSAGRIGCPMWDNDDS